jgi:hypothetical protein
MEGVRAAMKTKHLEADQWLNRMEWCLGSGRWRQLSQDRKDRQKYKYEDVCCWIYRAEEWDTWSNVRSMTKKFTFQ